MVPVPVSVYKAEVCVIWWFYGNDRGAEFFFCSDQNVMTLYITIVNLNCEPLKQGLFIKYFIHLTKDPASTLIYPP